MLRHYNITVEGKVQGVFFRASAQKKAEEIGISGFVKNVKDDSVYIEAEGEEGVLKKFIDWCGIGPARAIVKKIEITESTVKRFTSFEIKR